MDADRFLDDRQKQQGEGGEGGVTVQVPKEVADRFHEAKDKASHSGGGAAASIDTTTHKSGMEPLVDRARNLTAVTEAIVQNGGRRENRTPDLGIPARATMEGRRGGQPGGEQ